MESIINYDLDIANFVVISPQIRYIEVFDLTNPRFNEQIWSVPGDFVKSRFDCISFFPSYRFGVAVKGTSIVLETYPRPKR